MIKYNFQNDYSEGAHPNILDALQQSNGSQDYGYGLDAITAQTAVMIKNLIKNPSAEVHFVTGGTQANIVVLSSLMRPHEAVICADVGHINIHEAGAIEAIGHKILSVPTSDGKITPEQIQSVLLQHLPDHMALPRVVFISNATELGSTYSKDELKNLSVICRENGLLLYMDGARLATALCTKTNDVTLADIAQLTDVFYIGGTKNGALLGEAIIFNSAQLARDFRYHIKQRGGLLAKGRLLSIQFSELFKNNLWFNLAENANGAAEIIRQGLLKNGIKFFSKSETNLIFPILKNSLIDALEKQYGFYRWKELSEGYSAIRIVTSWATSKLTAQAFVDDVEKLLFTEITPL